MREREPDKEREGEREGNWADDDYNMKQNDLMMHMTFLHSLNGQPLARAKDDDDDDDDAGNKGSNSNSSNISLQQKQSSWRLVCSLLG